MKTVALAIMLANASCASRACGVLAPDDVMNFHRSHEMSVTASESSVEELASEPWTVCVEHGRAQIQNHAAMGQEADDVDAGWWAPAPPAFDTDYCATPHIMPAEEWRALCGQYPREAVLDGGVPK